MKDFNALEYREQIRYLHILVEKVLEKYGLQHARIHLLQYEDNAIFQIASREGEDFVLRISSTEGYKEQEQISEIQWLSALRRDTDLCIPEPVPTRDGAPLVNLAEETIDSQSRCCVLFRWIPGEIPTEMVKQAVAERIGEITATLHQHAMQFIPPTTFTRPSWGWDRLFGASSAFHSEQNTRSLTPNENYLFATIGEWVQDQLRQADPNIRDWGLIHSDLHRGNIVVHQSNVGVIDFDDCGWGYLLLDIATMLSSMYRLASNTSSYLEFRQAYLEGYTRIRSLPLQLEAKLALFLIMRDMVIVNFVLSSQNEEVLSWGKERINGIMKNMELYLTEGTYPGL